MQDDPIVRVALLWTYLRYPLEVCFHAQCHICVFSLWTWNAYRVPNWNVLTDLPLRCGEAHGCVLVPETTYV